MQDKLQSFIEQYEGQSPSFDSIEANRGNSSQVLSFWCQELAMPMRSADDWWISQPDEFSEKWLKIPNDHTDPSQLPNTGDIVVLANRELAIYDSVISTEQWHGFGSNGTSAQLLTIDWNQVNGWFTPKVPIVFAPKPTVPVEPEPEPIPYSLPTGGIRPRGGWVKPEPEPLPEPSHAEKLAEVRKNWEDDLIETPDPPPEDPPPLLATINDSPDYRTTYRPFLDHNGQELPIKYVALENSVVTDLEGKRHDVAMHAGDVMYIGGTFTYAGLVYARPEDAATNMSWYGIRLSHKSLIEPYEVLYDSRTTPEERAVMGTATLSDYIELRLISTSAFTRKYLDIIRPFKRNKGNQ